MARREFGPLSPRMLAGTQRTPKDLDSPADQGRVNKRGLVWLVSQRSGRPLRTVSLVFAALLEELTDAAREGETVVLTGFARFPRQHHKGTQGAFRQERRGRRLGAEALCVPIGELPHDLSLDDAVRPALLRS